MRFAGSGRFFVSFFVSFFCIFFCIFCSLFLCCIFALGGKRLGFWHPFSHRCCLFNYSLPHRFCERIGIRHARSSAAEC